MGVENKDFGSSEEFKEFLDRLAEAAHGKPRKPGEPPLDEQTVKVKRKIFNQDE